MAEPAATLGDGDGDGDDDVIECEQPESLYNPTDEDEIRRAFIVEKVVDQSTVLLKGLVESMDAIHLWLKDGAVKQERKPDNKFKVVKE